MKYILNPMIKKVRINYLSLQKVVSELVQKQEQFGVYHFNKILFLFEYFYIKNTGRRFLHEHFIKLPHGPVLGNYKRQLENLYKDGILKINIEELQKHRKVDSDKQIKLCISRGANAVNYKMDDNIASAVLMHVVQNYMNLSVERLEEFVYSTEPIKNFQNKGGFRMKRMIGGYVLKSPNLNITKYKKTISEGVRLAEEHLKKYPTIDVEQLNKDVEEFAFLEKLRPSYYE